VVKKKGRDKRRILKGIIQFAKSVFIKINNGEINQKGMITINDDARKMKK
jgi:hypothetical protein